MAKQKLIGHVKIISYEDRYASDFMRLNLEWLEGFDLLEDADLRQLGSPRESIIEKGGRIFFALEGERVLGTCAAVPHGSKIIEIAKLAVAPSAQHHGIGRALTQTVIDFAQSMRAKKVSLVSSTRLKSALSLYESMAFALRVHARYASADVYMELALSNPDFSQAYTYPKE